MGEEEAIGAGKTGKNCSNGAEKEDSGGKKLQEEEEDSEDSEDSEDKDLVERSSGTC